MFETTGELILPCKRKASSESFEGPRKHHTTQSQESKHGIDTVEQQQHQADEEGSISTESTESLSTKQVGQDASRKREFYTAVPSSLCTLRKYDLLQIPLPARPSVELMNVCPPSKQEGKLADHAIAPLCASLDQRYNLKCKYACTTQASKPPSKKKRETLTQTELPMFDETLEDLLDTLTITDAYIDDCLTSTPPSDDSRDIAELEVR
jgi:hypothetical protein